MPKARVSDTTPSSATTTTRTPVKIKASGTPLWYKIIMFAFMVIGLAWLVINYLAGSSIPFMNDLGRANFAIGFGLLIVGLLMTMGWR